MTKVTLLQTEDPITLVTPPNISEFLKAQLNDGKPGAALVKDVEAQIEQAASDAFGKEYVFRATIDDNGSVRVFKSWTLSKQSQMSIGKYRYTMRAK
ncbi:hypothetical protein OAU41_01100 [bacterium]|nr:hypothetical protein [bacterium]